MTKGMVVAAQPEPAEVGCEILRSGGNAVDAAVAVALTQTVVDPFMCGIAGFGSMHLYLPGMGAQGADESARHLCLDFHARAPQAVTPDMWADRLMMEAEDGFGFILAGRVNEIGYQAIATPETLAGLGAALQRFGTRSLAEVIAPAIDYAENGFAIRPHMHRFWTQVEPHGRVPHIDYLKASPATAALYLNNDGQPRAIGDWLVNANLANTYKTIAAEGVDSFYRGAMADRIAEDMAANGGLLAKEDLAAAGPEETRPLWGRYRGYDVASNPPPGGGVMVLQMLNILEHFDLAGLGHNSPDYICVVAEAMKIATIDKDRHVGDPRFVKVPLERLLSTAYAAHCADRIKAGEKAAVPRYGLSPESQHTTQLCVVDGAGAWVSLTHSLGMPAGVITEGLGFLYNGCMGVFDPRPGMTGSLAPGKARFTSMAPTLLFQDGEPVVALGAPGGTYIAMGVLQAILNFVDFNMDAQQAVSAPRFSATSDIIEIVNRIPRTVERALQQAGYRTRRYPLNYHFAGVHAIRLRDGRLDGGADPGRDGMVMAA